MLIKENSEPQNHLEGLQLNCTARHCLQKTFSLSISNGSLEGLKWLAVLAMTIDHCNRFFYLTHSYAAYCVGRIAMPLFAFIFAYNLARPQILFGKSYSKAFRRLLFFGVLATPAYMAMRHLQHIWPLNILFMLFITAFIFYCYERKGVFVLVGIFAFLIGGLFVEYSWFGILFCLTGWFFCRTPTVLSLSAAFLSYFLIDYLNGNHWALISVPLIFMVTQVDLKIPRIPYFFYIYYPSHLSLLWLAKTIH